MWNYKLDRFDYRQAQKSRASLPVCQKAFLELIEKIKRHGKRLSQTTSSEIEHETANVIYYAAIASALLFHDEKTGHRRWVDINSLRWASLSA